MKEKRKDCPGDAQARQDTRDQPHDGVERTECITLIEGGMQESARPCGEPAICITKSLSDASKVTDRMCASIDKDGQEQKPQPPPRQ